MNPDWDPAAYDYDVPERLIAHAPTEPREAAKLLVYNRDTKDIVHSTFRELPNFIEPGSLLVLNDTRVIAARFLAHKTTGGAVRILFLRMRGELMEALADRPLAIGTSVLTAEARTIHIIGKEGSVYLLKPEFADVEDFLAQHGTTPLPPYINTTLSQEAAQEQYQTVFAKKNGSAAAPTASLHFSENLLNALQEKGIRLAYVTLHVGLGTFAPLTDEAIEKGELHSEWYDIPEETYAAIQETKAAGKPIIAVGTTVTRALESMDGPGPGDTSIFIRPGDSLKIVDHLITNFHVPRSSLMQLVATLTGREALLRVYDEALKHEYRLFSFGDGMLIR